MAHRVAIVGSGNFGTTLAKVIGENLTERREGELSTFAPEVRMWVYEEMIGDRKLSEIINTEHENVKYLKGIKLPHCVKAVPDIREAVQGADYILFVVPHQFLMSTLGQVNPDDLPRTATGISAIKGVYIDRESIEILPVSISRLWKIPCGGIAGANIAQDVAECKFCESTIAFNDPKVDPAVVNNWRFLFERPYLRIEVIKDVVFQQLLGTLKNVVAVAGGFVDGLNLGCSTKAAILRIGMKEMLHFARAFFPEAQCSSETLLESCGVADTIATSSGGRNWKCAVRFAAEWDESIATREKADAKWASLEMEVLNGQKLQGVPSALEVYGLLKRHNKRKEFPLLSTTYLICVGKLHPQIIVDFDGTIARAAINSDV